ncbi:AfsR/SARP family transcriptional regulator [Phytohabitans rumicis]|uniref:AfsR/SARP family transcriptional regulator n=1 Tax=Phytohabitans rumicis TaxID=1076125 RepID=UPI0031EFE5E0
MSTSTIGSPSTFDAPATLTLLGGFALRVDGVLVPLRMNAQRLVAFLGIEGRSFRSAVAAALWPDVDAERALARLRTAMWRLRRTVPRLLRAEGEGIALAAQLRVDIHDVERAAAGTPYVGDLLPGWYDDWVLYERERLRQTSLRARETQAARHLAAGRWAEALSIALDVVRLEPLRESAHRTVMEVHLAEDNIGEALRQYVLLSRLLDVELGVRPSEPTRTLLSDRIPSGLATKLL